MAVQDLTFLNLHENENTSVVAAKAVTYFTGGWYEIDPEFVLLIGSVIKLAHGNQRRITFGVEGYSVKFSVDPNRIFTAQGRNQTLALESGHDTPAGSSLLLSAWIHAQPKKQLCVPRLISHRNC